MTGRLWVALAVAAGCARVPPDPAPAPAPVGAGGSVEPSKAQTATLLGAMASLAGVLAERDQLDDWAQKLDGGSAKLDAYIDELLGSERFAGEVIPALVFGSFVNVRNYYALPTAFTLKRGPAPDAPLYLRAPCDASDGVTVKPWWNLDAEVKVCPDAYRPEKWTMTASEHSYRTRTVLTCDSMVGSPELETSSLCGCGPNLIRCLRDEDQYEQFNRSFMNEVKRTAAYIVEHDLPMAELFTTNSTFRDRNVELYYRRQRIGALEIKRPRREIRDLGTWPAPPVGYEEPVRPDLGTWPAGGMWAPRDELRPGQHAGVLTAPQILHWLPDQRQRQRGYYEMLWCNLRNSFGATTQKVLELNSTGNNFLAHDSWKKLAHTEMCMNCHARLDYGTQFFRAYPDSRASTFYTPALQSTEIGPLYGRDISDPRGEAPLTPLGFARLATEQPDFSSCMANHFVSYVLGGRATEADVAAIETVVRKAKTFKAAMRVALRRYAERWRAEVAAPADPPEQPIAEAPRGPGGGIAVAPALRATLDQRCLDCHDTAPYNDTADSDDVPYSFKGAELPRRLMVAMTDQVAFGTMPKSQPLNPQVRDQVVGQLIDTLWSDPAARLEARSYYLGRARGLPAQQFDNALYAIDHTAHGTSEIEWGALERGIWSDQSTITPGFLAMTGLEALRACARTGKGPVLEDCVRRAASLHLLVRWPMPAPPP